MTARRRPFFPPSVSHVSSTLEARFDPRTGELVQRLTRCSVVAHNMVRSRAGLSCPVPLRTKLTIRELQVLGSVETANPKTAKRLASSEALQYLSQSMSPAFVALDPFPGLLTCERARFSDSDPGFFPSVYDCPTRRSLAKELAAEELERRRQEGLISEPESDLSDIEMRREEQVMESEVGDRTMDVEDV